MQHFLVSVERAGGEHRARVREVESMPPRIDLVGSVTVGVASNATAAIVAAFAERHIRRETER